MHREVDTAGITPNRVRDGHGGLNSGLGWCVGECVRDQVVEHLAQSGLIPKDQWRLTTWLGDEGDPSLGMAGLRIDDCVGSHAEQVNRSSLQWASLVERGSGAHVVVLADLDATVDAAGEVQTTTSFPGGGSFPREGSGGNFPGGAPPAGSTRN